MIVEPLSTPLSTEGEVKAFLFSRFFALLEREQIPYAILSNYFAYPEHIHSDVDFVVPEPSRASIPALVQAMCFECGASLLQISEYHNTSAYSCFIATLLGCLPVHLRLDVCSDDHRRSKLILPWRFMLDGRTRYIDRFFVPAPEKSLLQYLLKRIEKRSIEAPQLQALYRWFRGAPTETEKILASYWPLCHGQILECIVGQVIPQAQQLQEWSRLVQLVDARQTPFARGRQYLREGRRIARRVSRPLGFFLCFMGPDGCGKTTAIARSKLALLPAFRQASEFHLLPRVIHRKRSQDDTSRPHEKKPRSAVVSMAKTFLWLLDLSVGYWTSLRPKMVRSTLVIFDRYIHDLLVDRIRYRYAGPQWWVRFLAAASPQPDLWILLDAPAEILWRRKPELTVDEAARQRKEYSKLLAGNPNSVVIDASQQADLVVAQVCAEVFRRLEARTAKRFNLSRMGSSQ